MKVQGRKEYSTEKHCNKDLKLDCTLKMRGPGAVTLSHDFQQPPSNIFYHKEGSNMLGSFSSSFPASENKTTIEEFDKMDSSLLCHNSVTKHYMETSFHKHDITLPDDLQESVTVPNHNTTNSLHRSGVNDESKTSNSFDLSSHVLQDAPSYTQQLHFSTPTHTYVRNPSTVAPLPTLTPHTEDSLEEENKVGIPQSEKMRALPRFKIKKSITLPSFGDDESM